MCDLFHLRAEKLLIRGTAVRQKKWGSRLGPGAPRRRVPLSVSFSHRRVGSSILASLSEAGGNDLQKMASKPLPPHSPPFTFRHVKRAFTLGNAIRRPSLRLPHRKLRPFLCAHCVWRGEWLFVPKPRRQPISELSKTESGIASLRLADARACP